MSSERIRTPVRGSRRTQAANCTQPFLPYKSSASPIHHWCTRASCVCCCADQHETTWVVWVVAGAHWKLLMSPSHPSCALAHCSSIESTVCLYSRQSRLQASFAIAQPALAGTTWLRVRPIVSTSGVAFQAGFKDAFRTLRLFTCVSGLVAQHMAYCAAMQQATGGGRLFARGRH